MSSSGHHQRARGASESPQGHDRSISFEFFPPKTEQGAERLLDTIQRLVVWNPRFVSITCGADGSAIDGTLNIVRDVRAKLGLTVAPHIAMSRIGRAQLQSLLRTYQGLGIRHAVAIRGDAPKVPVEDDGAERYADTVEFVRDLAENFSIAPLVSAYPDVHPLAESPQKDLEWLKRKAEAGAAEAITQFFFDPETFLRFRDTVVAAGIGLSLTPGIMPLYNLEQILRFARSCGAVVPDGFADRFVDPAQNAEEFLKQSVDFTLAVCRRLRKEGVDKFHFYALNRDDVVGALCEGLCG